MTHAALALPELASSSPDIPQNAEHIDLRSLVGHRYSISADETLEVALKHFSEYNCEFLPVVEGTKVVGLIGRQELGILLSGRYGFILYAKKPIRAHMSNQTLIITAADKLEAVFRRVFSRGDASFYRDVVLVDADGGLIGVIFVHALVRLQNALLLNHVAHIHETEREISRKNAQMEEELKLAREMQAAFLPQQYPQFPPGADVRSAALSFRHHYRAAGGVSGDFLHVIALNDHTAGVFLCDVMGHGVRSALVTAMIRALLQELCFRAKDPADLLGLLNSELIGILKHAEMGMFATAMYMTVDIETGVMRYSIAGHAAPLHLRRAKGLAEAPGSAKGGLGPALGLFPTAKYQNRERTLESGDAIVLFTDGLYEAEDSRGNLFGRDRLMNVIAKNVWMPLDDLLKAVIDEVERYAGGDFGDDVCLLGVEALRVGGK